MNKSELKMLQYLCNYGIIKSKNSIKVYYNKKKCINTIIEYNYNDKETKKYILVTSNKIGWTKTHSIIKCYNDLINKIDLIRLIKWGLIKENITEPSYPNTSSEEEYN
jgi:hypothetical protein